MHPHWGSGVALREGQRSVVKDREIMLWDDTARRLPMAYSALYDGVPEHLAQERGR